ncbi:PREDICTED: uncharacterized protein LOC102014882 [Chinchilla lanigera]|uniref:uncharacterized protein LOC102014882 n=1 Tax=Chinchilla lanigera TaxID=34839 RepID=UPI00069809DE|nr:PREDICTED: uncharacterized protein LOC102014882 [Chinchilla lanigera]
MPSRGGPKLHALPCAHTCVSWGCTCLVTVWLIPPEWQPQQGRAVGRAISCLSPARADKDSGSACWAGPAARREEVTVLLRSLARRPLQRRLLQGPACAGAGCCYRHRARGADPGAARGQQRVGGATEHCQSWLSQTSGPAKVEECSWMNLQLGLDPSLLSSSRTVVPAPAWPAGPGGRGLRRILPPVCQLLRARGDERRVRAPPRQPTPALA